MSLSEEQIRSTWNTAWSANLPVWAEFTRLVNDLIAADKPVRPEPDTVAAIEAIQRLAQGLMDQHSGEEDAQAAIMDDMDIAEKPLRHIQALQEYVDILEVAVNHTCWATPRSYVPAGPLPERDADGVAGHDA